jgi:hypothetical protein
MQSSTIAHIRDGRRARDAYQQRLRPNLQGLRLVVASVGDVGRMNRLSRLAIPNVRFAHLLGKALSLRKAAWHNRVRAVAYGLEREQSQIT